MACDYQWQQPELRNRIYNIHVSLYFTRFYISVHYTVLWYLFFYRGMHDLLDYEGDDVEDVFCLTFEVCSNFYTSLGTRDKTIITVLHAVLNHSFLLCE